MNKAPKCKWLQRTSPESSEEPFESTWPNMLLVPLQTALTSVPSATQCLSMQIPTETSDDQVVQSLYKESLGGKVVDLQRLCGLVKELLKTQANLSHNIRQIDAQTQALMATNVTHPATGGGTYISPTKPPEPINWDQSIPYDAPVGWHHYAK
ncbi:hypothetical protein FRC11_005213 [Ceratobasidium sp. 423]|nr:hypothetical protein FRC11_005213 [Ceratobasidium sp. 423]